MFEIIIVKNILMGEQERHRHKYEGKRLIDIVDIKGLLVFVNGSLVDIPYDYIPQDGDQVVLTAELEGGMKGALGWILQIGLMVAAPYVGGWLGITAKFGQALAAGAFMILGGKIINSLCHVNQAHAQEQSSSPTYGWDLPQIQTHEGGLIGETFGVTMPAGQLLMYHVETESETYKLTDGSLTNTHKYSGEKDVQYLNVLYSGGYGPVDSIDDIRIGYTPIENFESVQIEKRLGTNDQEPISFFPNTVADQSIDLDCKEGASVIRSTDSDQCNAIELTFTWPGGIYSTNDKGNFTNLTARFTIGIRKTGSRDAWLEQVCAVTAGTNQTVRRSFKFEGLEAARYDVRVLPTTMPMTSRQNAMMRWSTLSTYINSGQFVRPNKVLIGLRIKATNQLNGGIPNLNWRQKRMHVLVFNPRTRQYEEKSAQNPIWAAYDILHHCRKLKNITTGQFEYVVDGCPADRFSKYFDEWQKAADYADEMVDDGNGSTERRFQLDAFFDTKQKRYEAANKAAQVGHATIVRHGVNLGIVVDMPGTMKQIFGEGRTTASSVSGSFSSRDERARSVQITYNDEQRDFKNTEFFVRSARYAENKNLQDNTANVTLFGVSRRSQAHREALYYLATNERQLQTIQLSADVNALVCEYGDIIGVAHTVPRLGLESGRIVSVDGNKVKLDKEVTLTASDVYSIIVQRSADDALVTRDVLPVSTDTTTDTITVSQSFGAGDEVSQYDCYAVGIRDKVVKPFRVVKLEQDKDLRMTITATEYDEKIYEPDYTRYPIIDYSKQKSALLKAPINLKLSEENLRVQGSGRNSIIHCTWQMPENARFDTFRVSYSTDNYNWTDAPTTRALSLDLENMEPDHTYYVRVRAILDGFESAYASAHIGVSGNILPATPATGVTAYTRYRQLGGQAIYDVIVNWLPSSLTGRVYYKTSYASTENVIGTTQTPWSAWVFAGEGAGQIVIPQLLPGETIRVAVTTANELGEYTVPDAVEYLDVIVAEQTTAPLAPENLTIEFTGRATARWNAVTNTSIAYYEVRTNNAPGEAAGLLVQTTDLQAVLPLTERQGTIFVLARNTQGSYSAAAQLAYKKDPPKAPTHVIVKGGASGIRVAFDAIPKGCSGANVYIDGTAYFTSTSSFSIILDPNVYRVQVAYTDIFGEGPKSDEQSATVKVEIDKSLLSREALGLDEIDKAIAKIEGDVGVVKSDLTGAQSRITQLSNSVDMRINSLDGKELISRINLSPTGTRIDGRLLHVTSDAVFDQNVITKGMIQAGAITADKMQVDSLSAITQNVGELHGGTIIGGTFRNNDSSFQVLPNGDIIGANIIGSRIDAKSVYAEGEQLKPVHVSTQVVDSGDKIVLPEGYSIEKSIIYVLEYDLIRDDYFASGIVAGTDYNGQTQKYYWINTAEYLPNKTDFGRTDWINGDLPHRVNEELKRRFPVHFEKRETKSVVDWFNNRSNFSYTHSTLMNQRVVWGIPYVNQGYYNENMFVFFGYQADAIFPQVRTNRMGRGVDRNDPQFGKHIVGVADDGTCYNCKVVYGLRSDPRRLYTTWGTIKVCVVSFW